MDPNTALYQAQEASGMLMDDEGYDPDSIVGQLVEHFNALDDWLQAGGFLPTAWERKP